jgi:hypothetical protein
MNDLEFLEYFRGGLDISGQRITARRGALAPHVAVSSDLPSDNPFQFSIQINHGPDIPMVFDPGEPLQSRLAKVDAAIARWLMVRP